MEVDSRNTNKMSNESFINGMKTPPRIKVNLSPSPRPSLDQVNTRSGENMRIMIVRHGESEGNVDASAYGRYGDHKVPLTADGRKMAKEAGEHIAKFYQSLYGSPFNAPHIRLWISPYTRTRQTAHEMLSSNLRNWVSDVRENVNLVEQDFGLLEGEGYFKAEEICKNTFQRLQLQKAKEGKFYARFPNGESGHDVAGRVSQFLGTLFRDKNLVRKGYVGCSNGIADVILVTHGVTGRAFIMEWFSYGPEWYQNSKNLPNASVCYIDGTEAYPHFQGKFLFGGYGKGGIKNSISTNELSKDLVKAHQKEVTRQRSILRVLNSMRRRDTEIIDPILAKKC